MKMSTAIIDTSKTVSWNKHLVPHFRLYPFCKFRYILDEITEQSVEERVFLRRNGDDINDNIETKWLENFVTPIELTILVYVFDNINIR